MAAARLTRPAAVALTALAILVGAACGDDGGGAGTDPPGAPAATVTTFAVPTTVTVPTSSATTTTLDAPEPTIATVPPATTVASTAATTTTAPSPASDTAVPTTSAPAAPLCPGPTALPQDVTPFQQVTGDVDGDGAADVVTSYRATDGTRHIFLQPGVGAGSDVTVVLGERPGEEPDPDDPPVPDVDLEISLEDFDRSLAAVTPMPPVVMAVASNGEDVAEVAFLAPAGNDAGGQCLTQWSLDGTPFSFTINGAGPDYEGLLCESAAGRTYYVLRQATTTAPDAEGASTASSVSAASSASTTSSSSTGAAGASSTAEAVTTTTIGPRFFVTSQQIDHTGPAVTLSELGPQTIPDDGALATKYGDIIGCGHPPLFR